MGDNDLPEDCLRCPFCGRAGRMVIKYEFERFASCVCNFCQTLWKTERKDYNVDSLSRQHLQDIERGLSEGVDSGMSEPTVGNRGSLPSFPSRREREEG